MKKSPDNKKPSTAKNILRRVLSKTSSNTSAVDSANSFKTSTDLSSMIKAHMVNTETKSINVEAELLILKQQISDLQVAVSSMQNETEKKEVAIANLAREKERLASDLRKQQRSYSSLKYQLDEEREFYYKEKELYCQEMNDCKKLKKSLQQDDLSKSDTDIHKKDVTKLKELLTQTLEANYNLSVKFLRMKNTKYCLKNRLKKLEVIHKNSIEEYNVQMEVFKSELRDVVDKKLQYPVPPSNKKYLQTIKQNGVLTHENLCLRLEVDRLNLEIERLKMLQICNDTNSKLKYINRKTRSEPIRSEPETENNAEPTKNVSDNTETVHQSIQAALTETAHVRNNNQESASNTKYLENSVSKLYDNNNPGVLNVTISPWKIESSKSAPRCEKELHNAEELKLELVQLSDNPSRTSTQISDFSSSVCEAARTQSAPEIVQTSFFVNNT